MSLTKEQSAAHQRYEDTFEFVHNKVNQAYQAAREVLANAGLNPANDDRAEALVAAIFVYVEESAK